MRRRTRAAKTEARTWPATSSRNCTIGNHLLTEELPHKNTMLSGIVWQSYSPEYDQGSSWQDGSCATPPTCPARQLRFLAGKSNSDVLKTSLIFLNFKLEAAQVPPRSQCQIPFLRPSIPAQFQQVHPRQPCATICLVPPGVQPKKTPHRRSCAQARP